MFDTNINSHLLTDNEIEIMVQLQETSKGTKEYIYLNEMMRCRKEIIHCMKGHAMHIIFSYAHRAFKNQI